MNRLIALVAGTILFLSCHKDTSTDYFVFDLYKYDTLSFDKEEDIKLWAYDHTIFEEKEGKLFLKNPDSHDKCVYVIQVEKEGIKENYKIRIKDWIENYYNLCEVPYDGIYPMLTFKSEESFFIQDGWLNYIHSGVIKPCSSFGLLSPRFNEMVSKNGCYAVRTGQNLYVSRDLENWKLIYNRKQTINKSMVMVENPDAHNIDLLFSEWTNGGTTEYRHYVMRYCFHNDSLAAIKTFYKPSEGLKPSARHLHILEQDPFTGDIWLCAGDQSVDCALFRSTDAGENFHIIGMGSQQWRTLSFFFTPKSVFWNMDTHEPQYINRIHRDELCAGERINTTRIQKFSIMNSACWGTLQTQTPDGELIYIMSSTAEGKLYDNYCRVYGVVIRDDCPVIYELAKIEASSVQTQLFPIGVNSDGSIVLYDHEKKVYHKYFLEKCVH